MSDWLTPDNKKKEIMDRFETGTPISDVMTTSVESVPVDTKLAEVARIMHSRQLSCLLIDDDSGETIGIITERDLTHALNVLLQTGHAPTVEELMTSPLITITMDSDYSCAMKMLHEHSLRRLVVVDDTKHVTGLITRSNLLHAQGAVLDSAVFHRTIELQKSHALLEEQSITDPMLDIGNRRAMETAINHAFSRAKRYYRPYSVALMDIDYFKPYNDFYGHQMGDDALKQVATAVKTNIRSTDSVFRYGGEEFLILLPETELQGALVAAQNIKRIVEQLQLSHEKSPHRIVTASFGVSSGIDEDSDQNAVVGRADEALYMAKTQGRNQVASLLAGDSAVEKFSLAS